MTNVFRSEQHNFDSLLLTGQMNTVTDILTVAAGQELKRGTVVGLDADTKEAHPVDSTQTNGTEMPYAVLAEDITTDTTTGTAAVYLFAELNANDLIVGTGTISDYQYDMRKVGLIVRNVQDRRVMSNDN